MSMIAVVWVIPLLTRSATGINVSHVRKKETGTKPVPTGKESAMTPLPAGHTLEPLYAFKIMAFMSIGWVCGGGLSVPALKSFATPSAATRSARIRP